MSKVLNYKLPDCANNYTMEDLYANFAINDNEMKKCMKCQNHCIEDGMITCKYIIEGFEWEDRNTK